MTKKGIIFHILCIVLLMQFFLLSSCSQAIPSDQNQTKDDIKITDSVKAGKVVIENDKKRYFVIPAIMENKSGWDWEACAASCMMFLDPTTGWVDQSKLYHDRTAGGYDPGTYALCSVGNYKYFHGYAAYVSAASNPNLSLLAQYGFNQNQLFIDVRVNRSPYYTYTVVMYGYDLNNNQIAYWNPHTGFCGWVNYDKFVSNLSENGSTSYSSWMMGVIYDPTMNKSWYPEPGTR
jgi:hypothetical protein